MCILITPISESVRLHVTGDVETVLTVPYDNDDRFWSASATARCWWAITVRTCVAGGRSLATVRESFISRATLPV